ncbi:oxidoreductase [Kineococcus aurantiacus]|uniref:NAD(P)-dependent dehydrogenase (Short-subunit alcohol dehydrogenase family) n=1 Tax=Kineococcus aurantiacus TaxID=37633 RepID=A0A7Y9DKR4_9ACTN|nr:oxidoreductase [Kineococcus aurantiacus]NYD22406.1 NAD(P)-dependent dehydrogenase (short-subunit alcohol dehydrogenase family) [Kineococcus aurantiacus]
MSTWFITGCSTGLGRALALAVLERGHNAVVTARDASRVEDIAQVAPDRALALSLDVTSPAQVAEAVARAEERFGGIDVVVNNAGYGYRAAVEEGVDADVQTLFATHVFGAASVLKAALPGMRARRSGAVLNVSSIGAHVCPPGSGYYAAAKAALEAMSRSLRQELAPLGISVTIVAPGGFRTDFAGRSLTQSPEPIADYADTAGQRRIENDTVHGTQPGDPAKAAEAMIALAEAENPPSSIFLGSDALASIEAVLKERVAEVNVWRELSTSTDF